MLDFPLNSFLKHSSVQIPLTNHTQDNRLKVDKEAIEILALIRLLMLLLDRNVSNSPSNTISWVRRRSAENSLLKRAIRNILLSKQKWIPNMVKIIAKKASKVMKNSQKVFFLIHSDGKKGNSDWLPLLFSGSMAVIIHPYQ